MPRKPPKGRPGGAWVFDGKNWRWISSNKGCRKTGLMILGSMGLLGYGITELVRSLWS